ncbi:HAMP domain-containing histidine kinase [Jiangella aurantiaca]|uniref:histidine kinase n=1 Tax=Jiangella aurantiaca TaxID=2530373 RepID=A0A4R5A8D6_9ACTN|nr:HAMP domain-containing sensor histidine kinase [Jiangella aurantiaca]TDD66924.1 HAMP domain-containing histidine kinase [Jiangella aurantiaca]
MTRWTLRLRLTTLYGGLFVLAGALVLAVTYLLVRQSLESITDPDREESDLAALRASAAVTGNVDEVITQVQAQQDALQDAALDSLLTQGALALLAVGIVAAAAGWLVAGRALRPLVIITRTARRIARGGGVRGLHERIALSGPDDEVKRLADTFDDMLEQLDRSFDGQRRFVANASHELRTPLALNRALVELAVTQPGAAEETQRLGAALLAVNQRHERLIDGLLTLADSEHAVAERPPVDLAEVAAHACRSAGPDAALAEVTLRAGPLNPAPTSGDPVLLERLAHNLIENAVRHNVAGGWLSVTTGTAPDGVRLTVANTGTEVPEYEVEALFQPFRRLGDRRAGPDRGFGLGLSIVRAVARAHGGDATAAARPGGGLTVTVFLPMRPGVR